MGNISLIIITFLFSCLPLYLPLLPASLFLSHSHTLLPKAVVQADPSPSLLFFSPVPSRLFSHSLPETAIEQHLVPLSARLFFFFPLDDWLSDSYKLIGPFLRLRQAERNETKVFKLLFKPSCLNWEIPIKAQGGNEIVCA